MKKNNKEKLSKSYDKELILIATKKYSSKANDNSKVFIDRKKAIQIPFSMVGLN